MKNLLFLFVLTLAVSACVQESGNQSMKQGEKRAYSSESVKLETNSSAKMDNGSKMMDDAQDDDMSMKKDMEDNKVRVDLTTINTTEDFMKDSKEVSDSEEKSESMVNEGEMKDVMDNKAEKGSYLNYEAVDIADLKGDIVLNFYADWCPSCRTLKKSIDANLDKIPANVNIVHVDYDSNSDLRKKYGVVSQHTMVQVNSNGDKIQLWQGGSDLNSIISKL